MDVKTMAKKKKEKIEFSNDTFFHLYRKNGFSLTLDILNSYTKPITESWFFSELIKRNSYLNEFYRVKEVLIKFKLIQYELNEKYDKCLSITQKGRELIKLLTSINNLLISDIDVVKLIEDNKDVLESNNIVKDVKTSDEDLKDSAIL